MLLETVGDADRGWRSMWVDATRGIAGDMLLAALLDAGAPFEVVRRDVAAVLGDAVEITTEQVRRCGQRATQIRVTLRRGDLPHRSWVDVRSLLESADLPGRVRGHALAVFSALADAEAKVHGIAADEVHFHEVGAWDSIADVVGVCSALEALGVGMLFTSNVAVGVGSVRTAHGLLPVPVPAVLELLARGQMGFRGLPLGAEPLFATDRGEAEPTRPPTAEHPHPSTGQDAHSPTPEHGHGAGEHSHGATDEHGHGVGEHSHVGVGPHSHWKPPRARDIEEVGELATPTGVALLAALADGGGVVPVIHQVGKVGVGAGSKDIEGWPNVVRVILDPQPTVVPTDPRTRDDLRVEFVHRLDANVDDLDPRLWPSVLAALLDAGAVDAWLTPILMKKGRPAHTVSALVDHERLAEVRWALYEHTSTLGVRETTVRRTVLDRAWVPVEVSCGEVTGDVRVKLGHCGGVIRSATPEFEDVAELARRASRPVREAMAAATAAAAQAGLRPGHPLPA